MRIGVQGQYDLYTSFNTREALEKVSGTSLEENVQVKNGADENASLTEKKEQVEVPKNKNGDIGEIAMRLKTSNGFGAYEMDIKLDESLKQYQYFVGDGEVIDSSEDGIVIQKSGFGLF